VKDLDPDELLAEARRRTSLSDFGDPAFEEPMRRLLAAIEAEAQLHATGRAVQRERILGLLTTRLVAEEWIWRHPEIAEERIEQPFVIMGLGRSGTTMLHRTIASDPRTFALLWWESRNPAPPFDWDPRAPEPRVAAAEAEVAAMLAAAPDLASAHPMDAHAPDEELMLLEHAFVSSNPEAFVFVPSYSRWVEEHDHRPAYRYMRRLLQFLQWQKKRAGSKATRWVLKTPEHLGYLDVLFEVFPDAQVIQAHRDPLETVPSMASLCHMVIGWGSDRIAKPEVGRHWARKFQVATDRCLAARATREDRFFDVWFDELLRDPLDPVRRIYAFVGLEFTPEAEAAMRRWAVENRREKRPPHAYTLEEFGLSVAQMQRDFAAYRERFGFR
jgi:hypothetical protein